MKKILLSFAVALGTAFGSNAQVQNYSVGQTVSDFTVTDIHGATHQLSAITGSGQWVLLDFFFTTCPPCQGTVPIFSELHQKYGCNAGDLFCLSVDTGDSNAEVEGFENTYSTSSGHNPAPAVSGTEGGGNAVVSNFGVGAFPTYCLIGPDMKIRNLDIWPVSSVADFENAFTSAGFTPTAMSCPLAVNELTASLNDAKLFPNPSAAATTLSVNLEASVDVSVKVYNMVGAEVATMNFNGSEGVNAFELNTTDLSDGQYIVSVTLGDLATKNLNLSIIK